MSRINWTQVLVFGLVALVVFLAGVAFYPCSLAAAIGGWGAAA